MKREPDKYDEAMAVLRELAEEDGWSVAVDHAWMVTSADSPSRYRIAHRLFQYVTPSGSPGCSDDGRVCGCLTQIKSREMSGGLPLVAWNDDLTERILNDPNIPFGPAGITQQNVEHLAEWQRTIDKEIRNPQEAA